MQPSSSDAATTSPISPASFGMGMSYLELSHSLADAFNALADEAQSLNDRRVVLEHKLRFAHEQVSRHWPFFPTARCKSSLALPCSALLC